jgi:hypothetical protein
MDQNQIIEKLRSGWQLAHRGNGWYISAPHIAYKKHEFYAVDESIVTSMEKSGVVRLVMPYNSIQVKIIEK